MSKFGTVTVCKEPLETNSKQTLTVYLNKENKPCIKINDKERVLKLED
tara:strand:+ start:198 stop:341 length:144 start_codon:yes stop_codon:yes gene_type:complete